MNTLINNAPELTPQPQRAAAVCYRRGGAYIEFLLIRSREGGWVFPKGGIEPGETPWQAAQREAFEEAGVSGETEHEPLTTFLYLKQRPPGPAVEYRVAAFLLRVEIVQGRPETGRLPSWFPAEAAQTAIMQEWSLKYAQELAYVIRLAVERLK